MNKWLLRGLGLLTLVSAQAAGHCVNSIDTIVNDMKGNHEAIPRGVPAHYDWQSRPRIGLGNNPNGANRLEFWLHCYEPSTGNTSTNGRVQIANARVFILRKDNNKWQLLQNTLRVAGASFPETYSGTTKAADIRNENPGVSVRAGSKSTAGTGFMFHGWTGWLTPIDPNNIAGVFSTCEARLIGDSNAKYLLSAGADYKNEHWMVYGDAAIGKFKWVTSSWKSFNMHTLTEAQIRQNPPPLNVGPLGWTVAMRSLQSGFYASNDLDNPTKALRAAWNTSPNWWERYRIDDAGDGYVALYSFGNNRYVTVDLTRSDRQLNTYWGATAIGDWEKFTWEPRDGSAFALKSKATGKYVSVDMNDSSRTLKALWANNVQDWEKFEYLQQ